MAATIAKLIDDVISESRLMIGDARVPYRYSDVNMVAHLNTALAEVYRYRPDAYIGNFTVGTLGSNPVTNYSTSDLGTSTLFPLDNRLFFNPVVFFVAGRAELADDEFTENSRSTSLLMAFRNMLIGKGG
jgi:hypothetical protein